MAYIQRNEKGEIIAVFAEQQSDAHENVSTDNPELLDFLTNSPARTNTKSLLEESDLSLVRVAEDLIYTLVGNNVIMFTDLPIAAREKLLARETMRGKLTSLDKLVDDNEDLL